MESRKIVWRETAIIAIGVSCLTAAMVGVFVALGFFQWNVLWGALTGCAVTIVNYFIMAATVDMASDRAAAGNVKSAHSMIRLSGIIRLVLMGVSLLVAIKLGANAIALLLPLLFVRPVLLAAEFFRKKGD